MPTEKAGTAYLGQLAEQLVLRSVLPWVLRPQDGGWDVTTGLLAEFQPALKRRPAQAALYDAWHRVWEDSGPEWLYCYDVPGLPPDNLAMESLFEQLRRHQRRVSGRKSTRKLRDFGQYQILFLADSEEELLEQIRQVPLDEYEKNRRRLAEAETPRCFRHRLHRDSLGIMRQLLNQHAARRAELASSRAPPRGDN